MITVNNKQQEKHQDEQRKVLARRPLLGALTGVKF